MSARTLTSTLAPLATSDADGERPILLVESDPGRGPELIERLRADGYRTVHARSTAHARALAKTDSPRAVLLGTLDTPHGAFELLAEIRSENEDGSRDPEWPWEQRLAAIVLVARAEPLGLLRAFELGADDFVAVGRRDSYLELRARLRALLTRVEQPPLSRLLRTGPLEIDTTARLVRVAGAPVRLARLEYRLLVALAREPHRMHSKSELWHAVWGDGPSSAPGPTLDAHACRVRRKLRVAGAAGLVVNVWGQGYRLS